MEKCWAVAGFDAGSPCGGSCGTGAVSSLPQPPRSGRDAISIPRWSLSEWWLINELGLQLSVRKRNCLFHPCHRPNWESLVCSMYRHQIHKKTFSKIAVIFTDLSLATLLSPGNTTINPGISFWGRETGRTNTTLLPNNFYDTKHKTQVCFTSTLTLKVSCTISSGKIAILQENTTEISVLMSEDPVISVSTWDACQLICFLFA